MTMAEGAMRSRLQRSSAVRTAVRQTLTQRGLMEVVTPVSTLAPGGEPHLEAPAVNLTPLGAERRQLYLRTSPEVWHKRLLAAGAGPLFEIAPCFRDEEGGPWHDLEFEMVEWYRPGGTPAALQDDCIALTEAAFCAVENPRKFQVTRRRVAELFDEFPHLKLEPEAPAQDFAQSLQERGVRVRPGESWDDLFFAAWVEVIEPRLKPLGLLFVSGFPASQAAMAKLEVDDSRFADRFEMYLDGIELANAFAELTDGARLAKRYDGWQQERIQAGRHPYPVDPDFFSAVDKMPPTVGIALGLDRLMALAVGADNLTSVKAIHLAQLLGAPS